MDHDKGGGRAQCQIDNKIRIAILALKVKFLAKKEVIVQIRRLVMFSRQDIVFILLYFSSKKYILHFSLSGDLQRDIVNESVNKNENDNCYDDDD